MTIAKRSKAGGYAWRRHLKVMLPWVGLFLAPVLAYPVFLLAFVVPDEVNIWLSNAVTLLIVGLLVTIDKKTDMLNARWGEGARGEFRVGEELEKLHKEGFHVFHDWYTGRGNIDHFVVGPQGVFAVETKAWTGEVTCKDGMVLKDGKSAGGKDPIVQAKGEAADVSGLIRDSRGVETWVHPVLCFSRAELRCYETVRGVEVTNLGSLRHAIVARPTRYSSQRVNSISYFLERHLGVGPAAKPGMPPVESGRLKRILDPAQLFVVGYALFLLVTSFVFAGSTATLFEKTAEFYRFVEPMVGIVS